MSYFINEGWYPTRSELVELLPSMCDVENIPLKIQENYGKVQIK